MSVGVLLLTEDGTGVALQHHVHRAGGDEMLNFNTLTINNEMTLAVLLPHIGQRIDQLDTGAGVLVLTDHLSDILLQVLQTLGERFYLRAVTGVNRAMLCAVLEHNDADLDALARYALNGARQAVQLAFSSDGEKSAR